MGQKVHPGGFRVGVIHDWKSNWWTGRQEFAAYLLEDVKIRRHILGKLSHAGLSDILIRKDKQRITVDIYTARPGIVIGKSGVEVDALRRDLHALTQKNVHININEIKRPELDAKLVAQSIAEQLENRVSFRRAMKRSLASAMRSGAQGIKITAAGRLTGGEMSRREMYSEGRVPLHTIRADIDYGQAEAKTTAGQVGVKVWINKGEIMPEGFEGAGGRDARLGDQDQARRRRGSSSEGLGASREGPRARCGSRGTRNRPPQATARSAPRRSGNAAAASRRRCRSDADGGAGSRDSRRRRPSSRPSRWSSRRPKRPTPRSSQPEQAPDAGVGGRQLMLMPRKTKFRRHHRGRRAGMSKGQTTVQFGDYGLKSLEAGWISNRQIEAARIAATRKIRRSGKVWINLFPDKPFTKKPAETQDGLGEGLAGGLGGRRQAGPRDVRAGRRRRGAGEGGAPPRRPEASGPHEVREAGGGSL